jgi:hypothetical protein
MRYVVLHHTGYGPDHFDLMFEPPAGDASGGNAETLETFRAASWPIPSESLTLERLGRHRRAYLEYEGPVSRGRGSVRRVASGRYRIVNEGGEMKYVLSGGVEVRFAGPGAGVTARAISRK